MKLAHKPNAIIEIRTGDAEDNKIKGWDYGEVWLLREDGTWTPHPGFLKGKDPGQYRSFDIELLSDVREFNFQSHLACYTGKAPFCFRAHRGNDQIGVARRRDPNGGIYLTECDPQRCPLRQNALEPDSQAAQIIKTWDKVYKYGKLVVSGKKVTTAKCRAYNFFVFNLLREDGSYAHPEGEFAMIATHSDTTHDRLTEKLQRLYVRCQGKIAGLRLRLIYREVPTRFGSPKPAWDLRIPEDADFENQRIAAAQRLQLRAVDYSALPADALSNALVKVNEERNLALWVAAEHPEAVRGMVEEMLDNQRVEAEKIDPGRVFMINHHPAIRQLIQRCGTSYAIETILPYQYGSDVRGCAAWFAKYAEEKNIYVDDLLGEIGLVPEPREGQSTKVEDVRCGMDDIHDEGIGGTETKPIIDAEYDAVDEPSEEELEHRVRGGAGEEVDAGDLRDILEGKSK